MQISFHFHDFFLRNNFKIMRFSKKIFGVTKGGNSWKFAYILSQSSFILTIFLKKTIKSSEIVQILLMPQKAKKIVKVFLHSSKAV